MNRELVDSLMAHFSEARQASSRHDAPLTERLCLEAWQLIPEPKYGWDSSYVALARMVALLRAAARHDGAIALVQGYLDSDFHLDYEDGPYFWLGTLHFEKGELDKAYRYLDKANRMSRGRCFKEEDPKYKEFLKTFKIKGALH